MRVSLCIGVLAAGLSWSHAVGAADLTITSGSGSGTYIRIAKEIAQVADSAGLDVDVVESRGSVHNLERLLGFEGVEEGRFFQLAIIQEDVLSDLRSVAKEHELLERLVSKIKIVLPLYDEEVHLFVRDDGGVKEFSDLKGRLVGVGAPGSGTFMTARFMYRLAELPWNEQYVEQIGGLEGLSLLKDMGSEALLDVAGAPSNMGLNKINENDGMMLAPITDRRIFDFPGSPYRETEIPAKTYPQWLKNPVKTAAVGSVLVAFDYKGENCGKIKRLTDAVMAALPTLRKEGHVKWKSVNPATAANRDDLYECVRDSYK